MPQCDECVRRMVHRPTVYVLVGPPASGKSTYTKNMPYKVISSDAIRGELFGDESIQKDNDKVFYTYYSRAKEEVSKGNNVILDATNLTRKNRKIIFKNLKNCNCRYIAIDFEVSLPILLERNSSRSRQVPKDVIERMYAQHQKPTKEEGFEEVWTVKDWYN